MKKQTIIWMLSFAVMAISPAFGMNTPEDNAKSKHPAPLFVMDIEKNHTLGEEVVKLKYTSFIQAPSGSVYKVYSNPRPFAETLSYLETEIRPKKIMASIRPYQTMKQGKIITDGEIRFIYKGGTYKPMFLGEPVSESLEMTFEENEIIFKKIDKSLYPDLF